MIKNPPVILESWVQPLGGEDPLEKEMATHSSILAWRIPWTGSMAGYSPWGHKDLDMTEATSCAQPLRPSLNSNRQTHPVAKQGKEGM